MAIYMADCQAVTLTIHKTDCPSIPAALKETCGCGNPPGSTHIQWICEEHIQLDKIHTYMDRRYWSISFCELCFSKNPPG